MREERRKGLEDVGSAAGGGWAEVAEGLKPSVRDVSEVATWFRGQLWGEKESGDWCMTAVRSRKLSGTDADRGQLKRGGGQWRR